MASNSCEEIQAEPSSSRNQDESQSLLVTLESDSHSKVFNGADVVLTLSVPHKLLHVWHKQRTPTENFTALINRKIKGRVVRLKPTERLNEHLRSQSCENCWQLKKSYLPSTRIFTE